MHIIPYIVGSGRAAQAIKESFSILSLLEPELSIAPIRQIARGESIPSPCSETGISVLCIATPHALHAKAILDADEKKFSLIMTEKPACVNLDELFLLKKIQTPVAVMHVYRQTWGVQTLKEMIQAGEFGDLISIEGRYWSSSTAQRSLINSPAVGWKNDPCLSGEFDTLLDIGVHWVDAALFLIAQKPSRTFLNLSYANAEAKHRDSHAQLIMGFDNSLSLFSSFSKTVHGVGNHFEINVLGAKKSATWNFVNPDQIEIGSGNTMTVLNRSSNQIGSHHSPFHALGWLEGYIEIMRQALFQIKTNKETNFPKLKDHLDVVELLLSANRF